MRAGGEGRGNFGGSGGSGTWGWGREVRGEGSAASTNQEPTTESQRLTALGMQRRALELNTEFTMCPALPPRAGCAALSARLRRMGGRRTPPACQSAALTRIALMVLGGMSQVDAPMQEMPEQGGAGQFSVLGGLVPVRPLGRRSAGGRRFGLGLVVVSPAMFLVSLGQRIPRRGGGRRLQDRVRDIC